MPSMLYTQNGPKLLIAFIRLHVCRERSSASQHSTLPHSVYPAASSCCALLGRLLVDATQKRSARNPWMPHTQWVNTVCMSVSGHAL